MPEHDEITTSVLAMLTNALRSASEGDKGRDVATLVLAQLCALLQWDGVTRAQMHAYIDRAFDAVAAIEKGSGGGHGN
jgi:hypothetical protein